MKKLSLVLSFFILLVFSSMFYSCDRIGEDDTYIYNPKILWENNIYLDNELQISSVPICVSEDNLVVISKLNDYNLSVYKTQTGQKHPAWSNDVIIDYSKEPKSISVGGENKDVIIVTNYLNIEAYSLTTQQLLWTKEWHMDYRREAYCFGNEVYIAYDTIGGHVFFDDSSKIYVLDVYTGAIKNRIGRDNEASFFPKAYINSIGDTLLICQERYSASAYNLTRDSLMWTVQYPDVSYSLYESYIQDGYLYCHVGQNLFTLDIEQAEFSWQLTVGDEADILIADEYIFNFYDNKYMYCHNWSTLSSYEWSINHEKLYNWIKSQMAYYNGMLYYISYVTNFKSLNCVDAATGNLLWTSRDVTSLYKPYVDQEKGILYTIDYDGLIAYDLNNSPVITKE